MDEAPNLPLARDLPADALEARRRGVPIVVLYSLPTCIYCSEVRRSHLLPMLANPDDARRALIRQIDLSGRQPVIGFDGVKTTHGALARLAGVSFAPQVAFLDRSGRDLAPALKGMLLPDFYSAYLDEALLTATAALRTLS